MDAREKLARDGEDLAARHLQAQGYRILGRRVRTRLGEIDILAEQGGRVVFIEVKTRRTAAFGRPAEAVDARKLGSIRRCAALLLRDRKELRGREARIDIIELVWPEGGAPALDHLEDAVDADSTSR